MTITALPLPSMAIYSVCYVFIKLYIVISILGISYYAIDYFIIKWKEEMWKHAKEEQVIEEIKYLIRKHGYCSDLETPESVITESINMTKYNTSYRIACYRNGLAPILKILENV